MRFLSVLKALQSKSSTLPCQSHPFISKISRAFSHLQPQNESPSFGIAFDIDGVILRGHEPVGGSQLALKRLYEDRGDLKITFLFLTNGGGIRQSKRAYELGELLKVKLLPLQLSTQHLQVARDFSWSLDSGADSAVPHSPFKELVHRFAENMILGFGFISGAESLIFRSISGAGIGSGDL